MTFITLLGTYCFTCLHFSLKNVRATFTRLIVKVLATQLGHNVDDMWSKVSK